MLKVERDTCAGREKEGLVLRPALGGSNFLQSISSTFHFGTNGPNLVKQNGVFSFVSQMFLVDFCHF